MSRLDELDAGDLRAELEIATDHALAAAEKIVNAIESGDFEWAVEAAKACRPAIAQVRHYRNLLRLGAVA